MEFVVTVRFGDKTTYLDVYILRKEALAVYAHLDGFRLTAGSQSKPIEKAKIKAIVRKDYPRLRGLRLEGKILTTGGKTLKKIGFAIGQNIAVWENGEVNILADVGV